MKWAVPMVCFCDIPLSNISEHTKKYGNYAIGIKKTWAMKQGVTPILYVHDNSNFIDFGREALNWSIELNELRKVSSKERLSQVLSLFFMMKPYEGMQSINGNTKRVRFYDEREWRYIPPINGKKLNFLVESEYKDADHIIETNLYNEQYGVTFNPDVINYIIVDKEDEIIPLMHELGNIKGDFPYRSVELLYSRIISMDRIKEDF